MAVEFRFEMFPCQVDRHHMSSLSSLKLSSFPYFAAYHIIGICVRAAWRHCRKKRKNCRRHRDRELTNKLHSRKKKRDDCSLFYMHTRSLCLWPHAGELGYT